MKQENFVKLMELRDELQRMHLSTPSTHTSTLKAQIKEHIETAISHIHHFHEPHEYEDVLESDLVKSFLKWFKGITNNKEVDEDKLLNEVFGRTDFYEKWRLVEEQKNISFSQLQKWKNALLKKVDEYFKQPMVTPEDYKGAYPTDIEIQNINVMLLDIIASEAGWRSQNKQLNDEPPNPAVESLVADIGKVIGKG